MAHYVANNPVNYVDPTGHYIQPAESFQYDSGETQCDGGCVTPKPNTSLPVALGQATAAAAAAVIVSEVVIHGSVWLVEKTAEGVIVGIKWLRDALSSGKGAPSQPATTTVVSAASNAGSQILSRSSIVSSIADSGLRITDTVARGYAQNPQKYPPLSVVVDTIQRGRVFNDPQQAQNAYVFFNTVVRNGSEVGVKVVYDVTNNVLLHVHFDKADRLVKSLMKAGEIYGY